MDSDDLQPPTGGQWQRARLHGGCDAEGCILLSLSREVRVSVTWGATSYPEYPEPEHRQAGCGRFLGV
jgi:hypothetical protein